MKKFSVFLFLFLLTIICSYAQNNETYSLDDAIRISAENINKMLGEHNAVQIDIPDIPDANADMDVASIRQRALNFSGNKPIIAVLNFSSQSNELSSYIVDELILALVRNHRFIIVDRQSLDLVRQEENYQLSGEVSDESAQSIGKKLGAQYVIIGSLVDMRDNYQFQMKVIVVETAVLSAASMSVKVNYKDRQIANVLAKKIEDDKARALAEEARRKEEEREQKRYEIKAAAAVRRGKWDNFWNSSKWNDIKDAAYLNMIQISGIAFQSDKDFSYIFDELGIRWSFLPFTSIGFDFAFGGNTKEPESFTRNRTRRAENLKEMNLREEDESPLFYGYTSIAAGLVFPLTKNDVSVRFHLFGDGLLQYGTTVYPGLLGDSFTPGFDIGFNFAIRDFFGFGMNIKYKGLLYQNNRYTNGILIGFTISPSKYNSVVQ